MGKDVRQLCNQTQQTVFSFIKNTFFIQDASVGSGQGNPVEFGPYTSFTSEFGPYASLSSEYGYGNPKTDDVQSESPLSSDK